MEKTKIDLMSRFKRELCSFDIAKKLKKAGVTCANTYFMYDKDGNLGDGSWLEDITEIEMYPAINFPLSVMMLEEGGLKYGKIDCYKIHDDYYIEYNNITYRNENIVDALMLLWLEFKK